jgi:hypothetical protein
LGGALPKWAVQFKITYKTIPGEDLHVLGSIPELGNWKEVKCPLKWTEGHVWVCEKPVIISNPIFRYKYVLNTETSKGISGQWEAGIDRLVDLRLLPTITRPMQYVLSTKAGEGG